MESAIKNKQLLLGRGFGQIIGHNGLGLYEVGGNLAQMFIESTNVRYSTNVQKRYRSPNFIKPLLSAVFLSVVVKSKL